MRTGSHYASTAVYLGIVCTWVLCQFEVPEDKLAKLEAIIRAALEKSLIIFATLEKFAGKCASMTVAVPAATLYTLHSHKQIGQFQRTGMGRV